MSLRGLHQLRRVPLRRHRRRPCLRFQRAAAKACATHRRCSAARGPGQGRLNWTGTLDEVQDFEHQIRDLFDGRGFMPGRRLHARDAQSTSRREQGRPQPGAGRAGRVRRLARPREPEPLPQRGRLADRGRRRRQGAVREARLRFLSRRAPNSPTARAARCTTSAPSRRCPDMTRGRATVRHRHADLARRLGDAALPPRRIRADAARRPHHEESDRSARVRQLAVVAGDRPARRLRPRRSTASSAGASACRSIRRRRAPTAASRATAGRPRPTVGGGGCGCDVSTGVPGPASSRGAPGSASAWR